MSELVFLLIADADIQTAYEFYEACQTGRGEIFMLHLDLAFGRLRTFPEVRRSFSDLTGGCSSTDFHTAFSTRLKDAASSSQA